ncbi:MAG: sugar transferase [Cytophagales bacterium]|nr:sugar transferase [Armatimonadota bacterium]
MTPRDTTIFGETAADRGNRPGNGEPGVGGRTNGGYQRVKRALDLGFALFALLLLLPLLLLIGLLVRATSPGPALFRQTRVGRAGKVFTLLKFRTMHWGTPDLPTDQMARRSVSPVTSLGRRLRRGSLDELPQLWNVVKGEMSLVGPRPALPSQEFVNRRREAMGVDDLLPGITGWAQISGRDDLLDAEKVRHDHFYRENQSLWLDLVIVVRTMSAVFTGRGTR